MRTSRQAQHAEHLTFFLRQKSLSCTESLMARIVNYCIKKITYDSHYIDVSKISFVRTVSGEQICARDDEGKLQVYFEQPMERKEAEAAKWLTEK